MLTLDRAARRIDRRSAVQRGQLWLAWRIAGVLAFNRTSQYARRRPPATMHASFNRTIAKIGRARRAEWRERHAI